MSIHIQRYVILPGDTGLSINMGPKTRLNISILNGPLKKKSRFIILRDENFSRVAISQDIAYLIRLRNRLKHKP